MRDYSNLDLYYEELLKDVYPQPMDNEHLKRMAEIIRRWLAPIVNGGVVLDVGCGYGEAKRIFLDFGFIYKGITLAEQVTMPGPVFEQDFNFLPDISVDLVFSRHTLEHSPFPLLTLMEWHRVSRKWLALVLPNPEHYTFVGRNHYAVMEPRHAAWILRRAGWKVRKYHMDLQELWFLCEKKPRIGYEGWAKAPISRAIYEFERDRLDDYGDVDADYYIGKAE